MADPDLSPTITNHRCNSVVLTPAGLYTDMAITVASHIWRHHRGPSAPLPGLNVHNLEVHKPLIVKDPTPTGMTPLHIEMTATLSLPLNAHEDITSTTLHCVFHSVSSSGTKLQENGHCDVTFEWYYGWLSEWSLHYNRINSRINALRSNPAAQTVNRAKAYKLFESFVQYSGKYQNMSSCVFDAATLEATSTLEFLAHPEGDYCGPYYHDGSCHVSGFVCNAVEQNKESNAFISNGVTAMKLSPLFDPSKPGSEISNYVQMAPLPNDKTVLQGDVYVIQDGQIVGVWEGVRFKKIPRRVLNVFFPPPKK
ncbi:hypothetical protein PRZ48_014039 [Zasmidium cellare]|uniref:PKS/mFAS DH domain-containing protein n=1 Tax=Zasmidium cellare TaxID=395010 RepID=A0ABR0E0J5_ZASCE|nr:hypothetical protein PRZ48_014039 [Zasmidium cellare]